jgi:hypothetical protein
MEVQARRMQQTKPEVRVPGNQTTSMSRKSRDICVKALPRSNGKICSNRIRDRKGYLTIRRVSTLRQEGKGYRKLTGPNERSKDARSGRKFSNAGFCSVVFDHDVQYTTWFLCYNGAQGRYLNKRRGPEIKRCMCKGLTRMQTDIMRATSSPLGKASASICKEREE